MNTALVQHQTFTGASVRGAAHVQNSKPNQDALFAANIGAWTLIAVADGHGGSPHFRSDRGSRMAVQAAQLAFQEFSDHGTTGLDDAALLQARTMLLPAQLLRHWRSLVDADLIENPLNEGDISQDYLPYGSTCALAAFSDGLTLLAQIGDGDIVVFSDDGILERPLPDDRGLSGEQTRSLCQPDAARYFRTSLFVRPHPLSQSPFALAATDGLAKSYGDPTNFLKIARHWQAIVAAQGMQAASAHLENWLAKVNLTGNGDDLTVVMFAKANLSVISRSKGSDINPGFNLFGLIKKFYLETIAAIFGCSLIYYLFFKN